LGAAFSPIFVRLSEVGPIAAAVNRMALPLPFFFALPWLRPQDRMPLNTPIGRHDLWLVVLSGVFFAGDLTLWFSSVMMTSVANASLLSNVTPVFVVLGGWLLFKDRPRPVFIVGLVAALAGSAIMMRESLELSARSLAGDFLSLAAAVFYAGYVLTLSRVRKRVSIMATMAIGGLAATLILLVIAVIAEDQIWPRTLNGWLAAGGMALFVQIGGQMLIAISLAYVPAGLVATMFLVSPVISALVAWPLLGESITLTQVAGAAALLAGLEISRRGSAPKGA
jgi:drug/metabolite transporter (DMT)-like permease